MAFRFPSSLVSAIVIVSKGLSRGVNTKGAQYDTSQLHQAVFAGNLEIARPLLEKGADVDFRDARDHTALHGMPSGSRIRQLDSRFPSSAAR